MKEVKIKCRPDGYATLSTDEVHIDLENKASKVIVDFSETDQANKPKWVDLIMASGKSLRYDLGDDPVVEFDLTYNHTEHGTVIITPFTYDGEQKVKWYMEHRLYVHKQKEAGDEEAVDRDDFIFQLKEMYQEILDALPAEEPFGLWELIHNGEPIAVPTSGEVEVVDTGEEPHDQYFAFEMYDEGVAMNAKMVSFVLKIDFEEHGSQVDGAIVGDVLKVTGGSLTYIGCEVGYRGNSIYVRNPFSQKFTGASKSTYGDLKIVRVWRLSIEKIAE